MHQPKMRHQKKSMKSICYPDILWIRICELIANDFKLPPLSHSSGTYINRSLGLA